MAGVPYGVLKEHILGDALDFAILDDIALARERRDSNPAADLAEVQLGRLGPFCELYYYLDSWGSPLTHYPSLIKSPIAQCLIRSIGSSLPSFFSDASGQSSGFLRLSVDAGQGDDIAFTQFGVRAQHSAKASGIPLAAAQSLVGALRELRDNIVEHSRRPESGILGFVSNPGTFEFCVADAGVGVLTSLRENHEYNFLSNSGQALQVALQDGESRYGRQSGRGQGFRELFRGLTKVQGLLRFHSDDHCLDISGESPTLKRAQIRQSARIAGFVTSVMCLSRPVR